MPNKKETAAFNKGEELGKDIAEKIEEYSQKVMPEVTIRYIELFKQRLETVYDDPKHDPEVVAAAELHIFADELHEFSNKRRSEISTLLVQYYGPNIKVALEGSNATKSAFVDAVSELIEQAISGHVTTMAAAAKTLYEAKVAEIKNKRG